MSLSGGKMELKYLIGGIKMKNECRKCEKFTKYSEENGFRMCSVGEDDPDGNPLIVIDSECVIDDEFEPLEKPVSTWGLLGPNAHYKV